MHLGFTVYRLTFFLLLFSLPATAQFDSKIQRYKIKFSRSKRAKFTRIKVKAQISDVREIRVDLDHLIFSYRRNRKKTRKIKKYYFRKQKIEGSAPSADEEVAAEESLNEAESKVEEFVPKPGQIVEPPKLKIGKLGQLSLIVEGPRKKGILRVPVEIISTDKSIFRYWLNVVLDEDPYRVSITHRDVEKSEARLAEEEKAKQDKEEAVASGESIVDYSKVRTRLAGWLGLGLNYLDYNQKNIDPISEARFESFTFGSLFADGQFNISQEWSLRGEYKTSPGKVSSSHSKLTGSGQYTWNTITGELLFINRDGTFHMMGMKFLPTFRIGAQNHTIPFLVSKDKGSGNIVIEQIRRMEITNASFGGGFTCFTDWFPVMEVFMRYQYTMLTAKGYKVSPSFTFDGSVGLVWPYKSGLKLGAYWYGQQHTFHYTFTGSANTIKPTGTQKLFYSNIDFRVGFDF